MKAYFHLPCADPKASSSLDDIEAVLASADTPCPRQALLLIDRDGEIRFRQDQLTSGADLDLTGLLSALDELPEAILPADRSVVC